MHQWHYYTDNNDRYKVKPVKRKKSKFAIADPIQQVTNGHTTTGFEKVD
jgi:hypothetical protein